MKALSDIDLDREYLRLVTAIYLHDRVEDRASLVAVEDEIRRREDANAPVVR